MNLNSIRKSIQNENVSYGEIAWLQDHQNEVIKSGDVELAQWAGIEEDDFNRISRKLAAQVRRSRR